MKWTLKIYSIPLRHFFFSNPVKGHCVIIKMNETYFNALNAGPNGPCAEGDKTAVISWLISQEPSS